MDRALATADDAISRATTAIAEAQQALAEMQARFKPVVIVRSSSPVGTEKAAPGSVWLVTDDAAAVRSQWKQFGTYDEPTWSPDTPA